MPNALGFAGGSGRIEQEQRMLRVHPLRLAIETSPRYRIVPPHIAHWVHIAGRTGAPVDDYLFHGLAALGQRLVDRGFQLNGVTPSPSAIRRNDELRAGVFDSILHGGWRMAR